MEWYVALALITVVLMVLLGFGQWIAMALGTAGVIAIIVETGFGRTSTLGSITWNAVNSFVLTAIPLFILMGEFILKSGVSARFYRGVSVWLRSLPGGLLHSNIAASSLFSAISGSSVATMAAIGTVSYPEMKERGYDRQLTISSLLGGGSVGMIIPPSIAALVYASIVEVSVTQLFMAGVVPGILLSVMFSVYIGVRVLLRRDLVPATGDRITWGDRWRGGLDALPVILLMLVVLGSIYLGVATATEAAALGAVGAYLVGFFLGDLGWKVLRASLEGAVKITSMLIFIIVGAQILSFAVVNSGITRNLVAFVVDLGLAPFTFFLVLVVLYVALGAVVDGLSLMLLTLPVIFPVIIELGYDPIVFGIMLIVFIELGQITPPVGLCLFVMQGVAPDVSMSRITRSALPIALIVLTMPFLLYFYPQVALWLTQFV